MKRPEYVTDQRLKHFISEAFREDVGDGDHSTLGSVPEHLQEEAELLVKEDCVLAGVELAIEIFKFFDPKLQVEVFMQDGQQARKGDIAMKLKGSARSILTSERLVLNCMQRMSGIASLANQMVKAVEGTNVRILDTRKTTPNFRMCEKWAVYIGGAYNHRYGLYDMVMLKDNHNDYAGGITQAVESVSKYLDHYYTHLKIEVETRNLDEVKEALATNLVDIIMLDNMSNDEMREAVKIINGKCKTEASGGITLETIRKVAETGVDYISSGAIIHSASNKDLSLKAVR
ncbi:MAG: carboxylating nicotinate-nucleotide diphosphorylase [Flavobacteriaceae bacterium]|jgi:nicotinate-nucleotide pyrophosphorylase (carboxylating)|nr:carboxylating nicotinate-nucleotide diphosphorylase [Flavobacteriaceae bacterium]